MAKDKATNLAESMDVKLGEALSISESSYSGGIYYANYGSKMAVAEAAPMMDTRISPEQVKVNLQPGRNMLLLKIGNGDGPHGFYLTIMSEQPVTMSKKWNPDKNQKPAGFACGLFPPWTLL